jgi:hypothetical protein
MRGLVRFDDLGGRGTKETETSGMPTDTPPSQAIIEELRHRLLSGAHCDSVEVKTALVGELVYQCFLELRRKRHL